jgi:1,4-dihydroxy-2-naphthoate octaprenyltransferase
MSNDAALIQKKRLTTMFAIDAVCFVLAGVAIIGHVAFKQGWLMPVFLVAIAVGLGAQIWFILGWMKAAKSEEEGKTS